MTARYASALLAAALVLLLMAACTGDDSAGDGGTDVDGATTTEGDEPDDQQRLPDVVDVDVERTGDDTYDFAVTISSPYDSPERYADGWRIRSDDGTEYGTHELAHDHAAEQPFTRTQTGVEIPPDVDEVIVEGHDLVNGYGGQTATVRLPDK